MELSDLILSIQKLELLCKSISGQQLSGIFKSSYKGRGLVLDSVRKYEIGDDIRDINWNATARFQDTYINTFMEDKERLIWLLVDVSRSGVFGTSLKNKFGLTIEIAATLAFSALDSKNSVGVLFFSDEIDYVIPPARGTAHFFHIARNLVKQQPTGRGTNLAKALQYLMKITQKHSSVFIISDFLCDSYQPYCKILAQQHELTAICVYDEREAIFPKVAWAKLRDAENNKAYWVNTSSEKFQSIYNKHSEAFMNKFKLFFNQNNTRSASIHTGENFMERLISFMQTP